MMRSLNAHLASSGSHGHLPFHPGCPVCRAERLAGRMAREPVISRRAQASLLAAVLALSAGGATTGFATAQVPGDEGSAAPNVGGGSGDVDPGDELPLPNEVPPPPPAPAGGDDDGPGGPVEGEPQEPFGSQGAPAAAPSPKPPVGPPASSVGQPAPVPPAGAPITPVAPPAQPTAPAGETRERVKRNRKQRAKQREQKQARALKRALVRSPAPHRNGVRRAPAPAPAAHAPVAAQPADAAAGTAGPVAETGTPAPSGSTHVVQRGESLWSIASDQLGRGASPARIAQQVNRLWELNKQRIATGDPDMLMVGTKLELPLLPRG